MTIYSSLQDICLLLICALLLGAFFARLKQSPLIGYLLAGMLLSTVNVLPTLRTKDAMGSISDLGVALLLFGIGLEFSWSRIQKIGARVLVPSFLQVLLTPLVFYGAFYALGMPSAMALTIGLILTLSSTAAVLRLLHDRSETESSYGRTAFAVLLMQDLAVVPFALVVGALSGRASAIEFLSQMGLLFVSIGISVALLFGAMRVIGGSLLGFLILERNRDMATIMAVVTGLGSAFLSHSLGLSPALGAFVAGLFLSGTPYANQLRADIKPFEVIFLTLFFGYVGLIADPFWIVQEFWSVLGFLCAVILGKTLLIALFFRLFRWPISAAVPVAITLSQVGEFGFILGQLAFRSGIFSENAFRTMTSVIVVSLFTTPYLVKYARPLGYLLGRFRYRGKIRQIEEKKAVEPKAFVFGLGPSGVASVQALQKLNKRVDIVDLNYEALAAAETLGARAHIGDVEQESVLHHLGVENAEIVVVTVPSVETAERAIRNVRKLAPDCLIIARSRYVRLSDRLRRAGADSVVEDEIMVSGGLADEVSKAASRKPW